MATRSKMLPLKALVVVGNDALQWVMVSISWARCLLWWDSSICAPWLLWASEILRPVRLKGDLLTWSNNLSVKGASWPMGKRSPSGQAGYCGSVSLASFVCPPGYVLAVSGSSGKERTSPELLYFVGLPMDYPLLVVSEGFPFNLRDKCAYLCCLFF